jgi:spermidine synthase
MLALGPIALRDTAAARRAAPSVPLAGGMVVAALLVAAVPPASRALVAYGRNASSRAEIADILYMGEGVNSSVAVSLLPSGVMNYHNAGKIQASSEPQDMRLQRMLGHLTTLVPEQPRSVVVIGCGAGVTAGAVSLDPLVERVTIVEIEPLVPRVVSEYFSEHNNAVLANPKVQVVIDDARHFMLTTDETFDAITSDPLDPWVKGAAALYTAEFLQTLKSRLNPGGVVTLFVQLYESTPEAVKSEVATFFEVFPNGAIWGNLHQGQGYDMVLMGQVEPLRIDVDRIQERLDGSAEVAYSLSEVDIPSALELFATYGGRGSDLAAWLSDAQINRDRNLRLQYLAGVGLNTYASAGIYLDILAHRRFPEDMFTATPARLQFLRDRLEPRGD